MASAQQFQGVVQFNDKEEASIKEAVKDAHNLLANNDNTAKAQEDKLILVSGVIKNVQGRQIMKNVTQHWKGQFLSDPPKTMGEAGAFVHQGGTEPWAKPMHKGSKGAVIYGTFDSINPGLGWLLAWSKPKNSNVSKVYVEAGNISKFWNIDWNEVEAKLDSSNNKSRYSDSETGAAAAAEITDYGGELAMLGATFDKINP